MLLDDKALDELPNALRLAGIDAVHGVSFIDDAFAAAVPARLVVGRSAVVLRGAGDALGLNDNQVT